MMSSAELAECEILISACNAIWTHKLNHQVLEIFRNRATNTPVVSSNNTDRINVNNTAENSVRLPGFIRKLSWNSVKNISLNFDENFPLACFNASHCAQRSCPFCVHFYAL